MTLVSCPEGDTVSGDVCNRKIENLNLQHYNSIVTIPIVHRALVVLVSLVVRGRHGGGGQGEQIGGGRPGGGSRILQGL